MTNLSENLTVCVVELLHMTSKSKFSELFKKYRLKAEFSTLSELGMALAEKGLIYEDSIFSHWQKGDRLPSRVTLIKLLEIFSERQSIKSSQEANEFLDSAGQGYLTKEEVKKLIINSSDYAPFQVPNQIDNFTGREELIEKIKKDIVSENIILISGPAGVGKTALAIHLGYLLQEKFSDGVLWYRLDTPDIMDILLSIAFAFGKDIGNIKDKETRASIVRATLSTKNVLLILDNVESKDDINLLLSNNKNSAVIITSRNKNLSINTACKTIFLGLFTQEETISLFKKIIGNTYVVKNKLYILKLADIVGYLPLALHIFAKELKKGLFDVKELQELISLRDLSYGDKNLYLAIDFSYESLDRETKKVFTSLAVFNGKDFSLDAVSYINDLPISQARRFLMTLEEVSLIEQSDKVRYRIHPMIKKFLRKKLDNPIFFLRAARYYKDFLNGYDKSILKSAPSLKEESDNVIYIFKKCYEFHYWNEVVDLWTPLESLLYSTRQLNKMMYLFQVVQSERQGLNKYQKLLFVYLMFLIVYIIILHFSGFKTSFWNYLWGLCLTMVPLYGGLIGFGISKKWGLGSSSIGKSMMFLSGGLLSWGSGNLIWAYYNFFKSEPVPYPSFADLGYLPSYALWATGVIFLPHAIGGKIGFKSWHKFYLVFVPIFALCISYILILSITQNSILFFVEESLPKLFLDVAYPLGDALILSIALIIGISFTFFGGKYKRSIYAILLGFCFQYLGDFSFSYLTAAGFYYNGTLTDMFFVTALSLISFGVLDFNLNQTNNKRFS